MKSQQNCQVCWKFNATGRWDRLNISHHQRDRRTTKIDLVFAVQKFTHSVTVLCACVRKGGCARASCPRTRGKYLFTRCSLLANKASRCVPTRLGTTSVSRRRILSQSVLEAAIWQSAARGHFYISGRRARGKSSVAGRRGLCSRVLRTNTQKSFCTFAAPRERDSTTSFIAGHLHQRGDAPLLIKLAAVSCPHQVIDIRNTQPFFLAPK